MLVPAILYKEEIQNNFKKYYYTDDMMFETGCMCNWLPDIPEDDEGYKHSYAIVDKEENLIGYIGYTIDWYSKSAYNFGLFSFDRGNPIIGYAINEVMETLIKKYHMHRIEWRMIGGNPVEKHYDKFCKLYNGRKIELKDVFKDREGNYHNDYIYEIILED